MASSSANRIPEGVESPTLDLVAWCSGPHSLEGGPASVRDEPVDRSTPTRCLYRTGRLWLPSFCAIQVMTSCIPHAQPVALLLSMKSQPSAGSIQRERLHSVDAHLASHRLQTSPQAPRCCGAIKDRVRVRSTWGVAASVPIEPALSKAKAVPAR